MNTFILYLSDVCLLYGVHDHISSRKRNTLQFFQIVNTVKFL